MRKRTIESLHPQAKKSKSAKKKAILHGWRGGNDDVGNNNSFKEIPMLNVFLHRLNQHSLGGGRRPLQNVAAAGADGK